MKELDDKIADLKRQLDIMGHIMGGCYSDAAYRLHAQRQNELIAALVAAEKERDALLKECQA